TTLASVGSTEPTAAGTFTTTLVVPSSLLVQGDNVIAVEVHQINNTSSDFILGLGLTTVPLVPSALAVTDNPNDRTVNQGGSTTFAVGFSGAWPRFQWYKWVNEVPVPVPGAIANNYTIPSVAPTNAGYYFVVLSNNINSAVSGSALLTVSGAPTGPTL